MSKEVQLQTLEKSSLARLSEQTGEAIKLSAYTSLDPESYEKSRILLKNFLSEVNEVLKSLPESDNLKDFTSEIEEALDLQSYRPLALAAFSNLEEIELYELRRPVPKIVNLDQRYYLTPLLHEIQDAQKVLLVRLDRKECDACLYDGKDLLPLEGCNMPSFQRDILENYEETEGLRRHGSSGSEGQYHGTSNEHEPLSHRTELMKRYVRMAVDAVKPLITNDKCSLLVSTSIDFWPLFQEECEGTRLVSEPILGNPFQLSMDQTKEQLQRHLTEHSESERVGFEDLQYDDKLFTTDPEVIEQAARQGAIEQVVLSSSLCELDESGARAHSFIDLSEEELFTNKIVGECIKTGADAYLRPSQDGVQYAARLRFPLAGIAG